jgi:hypothetical protein
MNRTYVTDRKLVSLEFKHLDSEFPQRGGEIEITVQEKDGRKWEIFSKISSENTMINVLKDRGSSGLAIMVYGKTDSVFKAPIMGSFVIPCESERVINSFKELISAGKTIKITIRGHKGGKELVFVRPPKNGRK